MHVPAFSIVFMAVSAIISIGLPVGFFVFIYKKHNAKFIPMLVGAAAFVVFALVLERYVHYAVFEQYPLREKPLFFILYGALMAGIFEETARLVSFKILKRKYTGIETGLSYGIGHGGIEAVLLAGIAIVATMVFGILIGTGNTDLVVSMLGEETSKQIENTIAVTAPHMFLVGGIERLFAITIQVSLSVIMFYSVYGKGKIWLYPLAIVLHAVVDVPAAAMQAGVLKSILLVECLAGVSAVILATVALLVHRKLKTGIADAPSGKYA